MFRSSTPTAVQTINDAVTTESTAIYSKRLTEIDAVSFSEISDTKKHRVSCEGNDTEDAFANKLLNLLFRAYTRLPKETSSSRLKNRILLFTKLEEAIAHPTSTTLSQLVEQADQAERWHHSGHFYAFIRRFIEIYETNTLSNKQAVAAGVFEKFKYLHVARAEQPNSHRREKLLSLHLRQAPHSGEELTIFSRSDLRKNHQEALYQVMVLANDLEGNAKIQAKIAEIPNQSIEFHNTDNAHFLSAQAVSALVNSHYPFEIICEFLKKFDDTSLAQLLTQEVIDASFTHPNPNLYTYLSLVRMHLYMLSIPPQEEEREEQTQEQTQADEQQEEEEREEQTQEQTQADEQQEEDEREEQTQEQTQADEQQEEEEREEQTQEQTQVEEQQEEDEKEEQAQEKTQVEEQQEEDEKEEQAQEKTQADEQQEEEKKEQAQEKKEKRENETRQYSYFLQEIVQATHNNDRVKCIDTFTKKNTARQNQHLSTYYEYKEQLAFALLRKNSCTDDINQFVEFAANRSLAISTYPAASGAASVASAAAALHSHPTKLRVIRIPEAQFEKFAKHIQNYLLLIANFDSQQEKDNALTQLLAIIDSAPQGAINSLVEKHMPLDERSLAEPALTKVLGRIFKRANHTSLQNFAQTRFATKRIAAKLMIKNPTAFKLIMMRMPLSAIAVAIRGVNNLIIVANKRIDALRDQQTDTITNELTKAVGGKLYLQLLALHTDIMTEEIPTTDEDESNMIDLLFDASSLTTSSGAPTIASDSDSTSRSSSISTARAATFAGRTSNRISVSGRISMAGNEPGPRYVRESLAGPDFMEKLKEFQNTLIDYSILCQNSQPANVYEEFLAFRLSLPDIEDFERNRATRIRATLRERLGLDDQAPDASAESKQAP